MSELSLFRLGKTKQIENKADGFTGDGLVTGSDTLAVGEVAPTLQRDRRFVVEDVVKVSDFYVSFAVVKNNSDTLKLMENAANLQKRGKIDASSTGTKGQSTLTMTTGFGNGGFGQLGVGGSLTQNV